jgi:hypothetical protein
MPGLICIACRGLVILRCVVCMPVANAVMCIVLTACPRVDTLLNPLLKGELPVMGGHQPVLKSVWQLWVISVCFNGFTTKVHLSCEKRRR